MNTYMQDFFFYKTLFSFFCLNKLLNDKNMHKMFVDIMNIQHKCINWVSKSSGIFNKICPDNSVDLEGCNRTNNAVCFVKVDALQTCCNALDISFFQFFPPIFFNGQASFYFYIRVFNRELAQEVL